LVNYVNLQITLIYELY